MDMKKSIVLITAILASIIFAVSCTHQEKIEFIKEPVIVENPNNAAPLTAFIDFEIKQEYEQVTFVIEAPERISELKYAFSDKKEPGYLLMLMQPGVGHAVSIEITDKHGNTHKLEKTLVFKTPPLPNDAAEFPKIQITKPYPNGFSEELTLFNPRRRAPRTVDGNKAFNQSFGMLVIINPMGDVLWYYKTNSRISDFDMLPNGNISYMTQDSKIVEIDMAGNIIQQWYAVNRPEGKENNAIPVNALTFHHDVSLLPNGNRLVLSTEIQEFDDYYTSERDENAPRKKQKVMGDVVLEFTPQGEIVHKWKAFEHMPAYRIGYETFSGYWERRGFPGVIDWSHANAVVPLPDEDAYLVNFRYQSAVIKVNKPSGEIAWIFAEPSGWGDSLQDKLLDIPSEGWNWHQHSPRFTADGNLLFFNNNNYQARPFNEPLPITESPSYVVEYKINEEEKTVEKVWTSENRSIEGVVSIAMGRVSELPETGNILAGYGALLPKEHFDEMTWWNRAQFPQLTMVREYTHTTPASVVWEMRLLPLEKESAVGWTLFGAERIKLLNVHRTSVK